MPRFNPLKELFLSRTRQFFREPETIFWVYFFPLILMAALGLAFRDNTQEHQVRVVAATEVERNRVSIVDDVAAKVECRTCYTAHNYRHGKSSAKKKVSKKAALFDEVLSKITGQLPD